jgi:YhcH/YjgK/YiaL family protein
MIVQTLEKALAQAALSPAMKKGLEWLVANGAKDLPVGRVEIDGDQCFALVQAYDSKTGDLFFEGHKKYIDLQFVAAGAEALGWALTKDAEITRPYVDERDMWLGTVPADKYTMVAMPAGQVAILYPEDAHAPMRAAGAPMPIKKIVVKVAVNG